MTQDEKNLLTQINKDLGNTKNLLAELFMPIKTIQQKYNCNTQQACNLKIKAEDYCRKYAVLNIELAQKNINKLFNS